jgi:hypothetical protein
LPGIVLLLIAGEDIFDSGNLFASSATTTLALIEQGLKTTLRGLSINLAVQARNGGIITSRTAARPGKYLRVVH